VSNDHVDSVLDDFLTGEDFIVAEIDSVVFFDERIKIVAGFFELRVVNGIDGEDRQEK